MQTFLLLAAGAALYAAACRLWSAAQEYALRRNFHRGLSLNAARLIHGIAASPPSGKPRCMIAVALSDVSDRALARVGQTITDRQAACLAVQCFIFRRQMPASAARFLERGELPVIPPDLVPPQPPPGYQTPRQRHAAAVARAISSH